MRILIIGNFRLPDGSASANYIMGIQKIFSALGHNAIIIDKRNDNKSYKKNDTKTIKLKSGKIGVFQDYFRFALIRELLSIQYDIIMPYNFSSYQLFRIFKFCKKYRKVFIPITTEWYDWRDVNNFEKPIKALDIFMRMVVINKKARYHLVCSTFLSQYYNRSKILYIPTIAEPNNYPKNSPRYLNGKLNLIYIGNPGKHKEDLGFFITALIKSELYENCIFNIFGIDLEQFKKIFTIPIDIDNTIDSRIIFHGFVSQEIAIEALRNSDFSVIFRDVNRQNIAGFPTKFGVSIANGIPVLATDVGDIHNFLISEKNGYYLPTNKFKLVNTLNIFSRQYLSGDFILSPDFDNRIFSTEQYLSRVSDFLSIIRNDNHFIFSDNKEGINVHQ